MKTLYFLFYAVLCLDTGKYSIGYFILKLLCNPKKLGILFCIKEMKIYCFTYKNMKLITLLLLDNGYSPRKLLNTIKRTLSEVFCKYMKT